MMMTRVAELVEAIETSQLLDAAQFASLQEMAQTHSGDARALARDLLDRGWLTAYQINQVFQGRAAELNLDQYVLLERIGEGGMGRVFKARHRQMGRLTALKVLRRDRMDNPDAVKRFYREVQAAAQLSHPNIVTAYDAGEVGGLYFLAMEFVDGSDLGRLVKHSGPVPVADACEYVRQAALGLQHAHEKGLVHRDIKPSNLLLTSTRSTTLRGPHASLPWKDAPASAAVPVVKILDMGVARFKATHLGDASNTLTQAEMILGTPDFIAPEQARRSHAVDIRSDLYSLGCSFYYLLTGQVPFPADSPMEKLLSHTLEEAAPIEKLRPEVPRPIVRLVRRLMAKSPEDRCQSPAELAKLLGDMTCLSPVPAVSVPLAIPLPESKPAPGGGMERLFETVPELDLEYATTESLNPTSPLPKPRRKRGWAIVTFLALVILAIAIILYLWTGL